MAPAYKLTYFDIRGLAETTRYLFHYGGIEFEDVRLSRENDDAAWKAIKDTMPFGQVPVLEYNGKKVNQSQAIQRYVAKQVGLAGNNDWENLEIDAIADTFTDLRLKLSAFWTEKDPEKQKVIVNTFLDESIPFYLGRFEERVKKNGYLALDRLTWVDVNFAATASLFQAITGADILKKYPNLLALQLKVESQPGIKKWIEIRPKTEF